MKKSTLLLVAVVGACTADSTEAGVAKVGIEDPEALADPDGDGVAVGEIDGAVASMSFELKEPLPEIDGDRSSDDDALMDVVDATEIIVSDRDSNVSVSLADGIFVDEKPDQPGEYTARISEERTVIDIEWYNETTDGLKMAPGKTYTVVFSIGENCCVDAIAATTTSFEFM